MSARHGVRPELLENAELVEIDTLLHYPGNARLHDDDLLLESLATHGQYKASITVQRSTRYVVTGNGTLDAAVALGWTHVAVTWIDCDAAEALRMNLVDNAASDAATDDPADLAAQLAKLNGDYQGTGYSQARYDGIVKFINEPLTFDPPPAPTGNTTCPACGNTFTAR